MWKMMIRSMIKTYISQFVDAGVLTKENGERLWELIGAPSDLYNEYNSVQICKDSSYTFSFVTLMMLKHNLATYSESTPVRQAVRDLFDANPVEYKKLIGGDPKLTGFFVGRTMKINPRFNPKEVQQRISQMIQEDKQPNFWEI